MTFPYDVFYSDWQWKGFVRRIVGDYYIFHKTLFLQWVGFGIVYQTDKHQNQVDYHSTSPTDDLERSSMDSEDQEDPARI